MEAESVSVGGSAYEQEISMFFHIFTPVIFLSVVSAVPLAGGDRLMLCTGGLHKCLEDEAVLLQLFYLDVQEAGPVTRAHHCGEKDNVTAVFVEVTA